MEEGNIWPYFTVWHHQEIYASAFLCFALFSLLAVAELYTSVLDFYNCFIT